MTDDSNNHLKRWWNSFEPGDLVRQKKEFIGTPLRFWARMASMGIFEFPSDIFFSLFGGGRRWQSVESACAGR